MTTWRFEKQFVNKLSLLRIILQRKGKTGVLCFFSSETNLTAKPRPPPPADHAIGRCRQSQVDWQVFERIKGLFTSVNTADVYKWEKERKYKAKGEKDNLMKKNDIRKKYKKKYKGRCLLQLFKSKNYILLSVSFMKKVDIMRIIMMKVKIILLWSNMWDFFQN